MEPNDMVLSLDWNEDVAIMFEIGSGVVGPHFWN